MAMRAVSHGAGVWPAGLFVVAKWNVAPRRCQISGLLAQASVLTTRSTGATNRTGRFSTKRLLPIYPGAGPAFSLPVEVYPGGRGPGGDV